MEVFAHNFRDWLQGRVTSSRPDVEFHPDIVEILKVAFGASLEDRSGLISLPDVRYNLFSYQDPIFKSNRYILYLHPGITISRTAAHFDAAYRTIVEGRSILILVDPKGVQNRDTWMRTVRTSISASNAMFLDDFVKERFAVNILRARAIPGVVAPRLRRLADDKIIEGSFDYFVHSVTEEGGSSSIIVIKGQGGIGKTTLCRELSSRMSERKATDVVVLGAYDIIKRLADSPELGSSFTLFNLLRATLSNRELGALGEQEFAWIFDMGRISIVIDGIDEIVPRLRPRAFSAFFESIEKYSNYLRRGKIILTCRDGSFIVPRIGVPHDEYDILPFDEQQIEEYIAIRFPKIASLQDGANQFLSELRPYMPDILPFVLRVVCDSVEDARQISSLATSLVSDILDITKKFDYVVYKVCEREEAKYKYSRFLGSQNPVDVQCGFFLKLASHYHGSCGRDQIKGYFSGYSSDADESAVNPFFSHPLLHSPHHVRFSDDVVSEFFLCKFLVRVLQGKAASSVTELSDIADKAQLDSQFLADVAAHFGHLTPDLLLRIDELIGEARTIFLERSQPEEYFRHASAFFNLGLQIIQHDRASYDLVSQVSAYAAVLFRTNAGVMQHVPFHNIPAQSPIVFDFSSLIFEKASVLNYEGFARCKFSVDTIFRSSRIRTGMPARQEDLSVDPVQPDTLPAEDMGVPTGQNFVNCQIDPIFLRSIVHTTAGDTATPEDAIRHLESFLQPFRRDNSFAGKIGLLELEASFTLLSRLDFGHTIEICCRNGLLEQDGQFAWIAIKQVDNVEAFVTERIHRGIIEKTIISLLEEMRTT